MHIGIDCRLPYYQMGGISQYTLHLIQALAEIDTSNPYTILHSRKDGRSHLPTAANFRRHNAYTPCHHRLERYALSAELLPLRCDVWHSPDFIPPAFGAPRRIITVHDLNFLHFPDLLTAESRRYYNQQIAWATRTADHISADSEATRQDLIHLLRLPPEKITTIPLSVNPVYQKSHASSDIAATLQKYHLPQGFILCVGTLEPRKNLPMLLHAYHQLRHQLPDAPPLVLVGKKGWLYEAVFDTIAQLHLAPHIHHLANTDNNTLAHLYAAASLLVTPSLYEGFGLPALEAQNSGCPVIVSNRGSLPEIVGPDGLLLPPDDSAAWAGAMAQLLTDSTRREQLIANGRSQASRFSWQKAAHATLQLYQGK